MTKLAFIVSSRGFVGMICKYFITVGGIKSEIKKSDLKNWNEVEYSFKRSEFTGVVQSFSSSFDFVGETADRITDEFFLRGLYASAYIEVYTCDNRWNFSPVFSCPLDFSSYKSEGGIVSINAIDNTLSAIIKAGKGKKYEFLMTDIRERKDCEFIYDGVDLENFVSFDMGSRTGDETPREFTILANEENQKITLVVKDEDVISAAGMEHAGQTSEAFKILTADELRQKGPEVIPEGVGYTYPYGAETDGSNRILKNGSDANVDVNVDISFEIKVPAYLKPEDVEFYVSTAIGSTETKHDGNIYNRYDYGQVMSAKMESPSPWTYSLKRSFTLYPRYSLMLFARLKTPNSFIASVISSKVETTWKGVRFPSKKIDYVKPLPLLKKIVDAMVMDRHPFQTEGTFGCRIAFRNDHENPENFRGLGSSNFDSRLDETILIPADAITLNPDSIRYIKTSFDDFCKWMETVFGYVYYIEGNDIVFKHRDQVFVEKVQKEIGHTEDISYKVNKKTVFSTLEIGYKNDDEDHNNKSEFNRTVEYDTGIINTEKKMSLISPYRADSVGFQRTFQEGFDKREEEKDSSDGIWCVHTQKISDGGIDVRKVVKARLDSYTYDPKNLFNHYLSPVYCLKANSRYISSFVDKLTLTTAYFNDVNLKIYGGVLSMKRDFDKQHDDCDFFKSPLFSIGELSFSTSDIVPQWNFAYPLRIYWNGKAVVGYVSELTNRYQRTEASEYKIIVKNIK